LVERRSGRAEGDLGPFDRAVRVVLAVEDEQGTAGVEAEHARTVELVEHAGDDLVPELAADAGVDLWLAQVLRDGLMGGENRAGAPLPAAVVETPAEALHCDERHGDLDPLVDRAGEPGLNPPHADPDEADP